MLQKKKICHSCELRVDNNCSLVQKKIDNFTKICKFHKEPENLINILQHERLTGGESYEGPENL